MMMVEHIIESNICIIKMSGKILGGPDSMQFNQLMNTQLDVGLRHFVIDFAGVELMNSTGLGIIIQTMNMIKQKKGKLKLASLGEKMESLLKITKLNTVFDRYTSIEEAKKSF